MATSLNIFGGIYYLSLYDSTNGYYHFNFKVDAEFSEKASYNPTIAGQRRVYEVVRSFKINVNESDQALIDELRTRSATKQEIYLFGADHLLFGQNLYITTDVKRVAKGHELTIEASTNVAADALHRVNLLDNSDFELNDSSIATGWYGDDTDIIASHRTGDAQEFSYSSVGGTEDNVYTTQRLPLQNGQRVTISAYFKGDSGASASVTLALQVIASNGSTVLDTISVTDTLDTDEEIRLTASDTLSLASGGATIKVIVTINTDERSVSFDDMQIELGDLSTYRNY